jgi:excisionase family DNA binding protein
MNRVHQRQKSFSFFTQPNWYFYYMDNFLTTAEIANRLLITPARVRQIIAEGSLHAEKVGRDYVVRQADLAKYVKRPKEKRGRPKKILACTK